MSKFVPGGLHSRTPHCQFFLQTFRADYIDWCLPLFDSGSTSKNNYTCTFLATQGNMYFVNHTATAWKDNECCLFGEGLAAVPPDWMKNTQYNGTASVRVSDGAHL